MEYLVESLPVIPEWLHTHVQQKKKPLQHNSKSSTFLCTQIFWIHLHSTALVLCRVYFLLDKPSKLKLVLTFTFPNQSLSNLTFIPLFSLPLYFSNPRNWVSETKRSSLLCNSFMPYHHSFTISSIEKKVWGWGRWFVHCQKWMENVNRSIPRPTNSVRRMKRWEREKWDMIYTKVWNIMNIISHSLHFFMCS